MVQRFARPTKSWASCYAVSWLASIIFQRSSSITNWAAQIARERFVLDSPQSTWTSTPIYSATTPVLTSLATSGQTFSWNICRQCPMPSVRIYQERFKGRSSNYFHSYREQSALQAHRIWPHLLISANAIKYCVKRVWPAKSRIIRPLFQLELPNFTWTPTYLWHTGYASLLWLKVHCNGDGQNATPLCP